VALKSGVKVRARTKRLSEDDQVEEKAAPVKALRAAKKTAASAKKSKLMTAAKKLAAKELAAKKLAAQKLAAKKLAAQKLAERVGANKGNVKCPPINQHRIPVDDSVGQSDPGARERDPFEVAKQTMKGSVPAIVQAMVELAKQGSCSHAKTLLEMTGAKHMFDSEAEMQGSGEPWAKLVLERLDEAAGKAGREAASLQEGSAEFSVR
jgi:hypothetical protein